MADSKETSATEEVKSANEAFTNIELDRQKEAIGADLATLLVQTLKDGKDPFEDFPGLTTELKNKQDELDLMAADSLPSAILNDYVSDTLTPNSSGDLVSIVANEPNHQQILTDIYKRLNLPLEKIVYLLVKNGMCIGQFEQVTEKSVASQVAANESVAKSAQEETYVRKPGSILPNISIILDTYTVFPILKYERCIGYIEVRKDALDWDSFKWETDTINYKDVVIHQSLDYVYETFGVQHSSKPIQLSILTDSGEIEVYTVATGASILEDAYSSWKTLSLLEDSIVLASLIKNTQAMLIEVEAGTASKQQIEAAKIQLRSLFEGQLSMGRQGMKSYLNPQSKPAFIYSFTSNGVGKITASLVGGEYNPGTLSYLNPFINQFFAAMGVAKQNYGYTEGAGGLDGGGAVEQYNKRYLSTIGRLKRILGSFIKKAINNVLLSKGLTNLVDEFSVKVYSAYDEVRNQEMQELQGKLGLYESIIQFTGIEDPEQLRKLRSLMIKQIVTDPEITKVIDQTMTPDNAEAAGDTDIDLNMGDLGDSQISPDAGNDLGGLGGPPDEGGPEVPEPDASLELPEMSDTLGGEGES